MKYRKLFFLYLAFIWSESFAAISSLNGGGAEQEFFARRIRIEDHLSSMEEDPKALAFFNQTLSPEVTP